MSEYQPHEPEQEDYLRDEGYQYQSMRDRALHTIVQLGWANETRGNTSAVTGLFARISNSPEELDELRGAFEGMFSQLGLEPSAVLGHFIVVEDQAQVVNVVEYQDHGKLLAAYEELRLVYEAWRGQPGVQ